MRNTTLDTFIHMKLSTILKESFFIVGWKNKLGTQQLLIYRLQFGLPIMNNFPSASGIYPAEIAWLISIHCSCLGTHCNNIV